VAAGAAVAWQVWRAVEWQLAAEELHRHTAVAAERMWLATLDMVKSVRGAVRVTSTLGEGTRFQLQLALMLSVVRTLLVEIAGEPYAEPLTAVSRTLKLDHAAVENDAHRQAFIHDGRRVPLVTAPMCWIAARRRA
jgi:hypothetical protein